MFSAKPPETDLQQGPAITKRKLGEKKGADSMTNTEKNHLLPSTSRGREKKTEKRSGPSARGAQKRGLTISIAKKGKRRSAPISVPVGAPS